MNASGRRGFTLIELAVAGACGLLVAAGAAAGFGQLLKRYRAIVSASVYTETSLRMRNEVYFNFKDQNGKSMGHGVLNTVRSDWKHAKPDEWLSSAGAMGNFWTLWGRDTTSVTNAPADFGGFIRRANDSGPALPERTVFALVPKRETNRGLATGGGVMRGFEMPIAYAQWFVRQSVPRPNLPDRPQGGYHP